MFLFTFVDTKKANSVTEDNRGVVEVSSKTNYINKLNKKHRSYIRSIINLTNTVLLINNDIFVNRCV